MADATSRSKHGELGTSYDMLFGEFGCEESEAKEGVSKWASEVFRFEKGVCGDDDAGATWRGSSSTDKPVGGCLKIGVIVS